MKKEDLSKKKKQRIIAIIPARGGSKGLPRKNIKLLNGKPLIAYTIEEALKSKFLDRVFVSTEDDEIAKISKNYGAEIIQRPKDLAEDDSLRRDVIKHVIQTLKSKLNYEAEVIVYLQPTSPLRTVTDIDSALDMYLKNRYDSVVSVCKSSESPYWSLTIKNQIFKPLFGWDYFMNKQRQDLPTSYILNGALYITSVKKFIQNNNLFSKRTLPYIMPIERSIDIDDDLDFKLAELLIKREDYKEK